mmetsp:Transcript_15750/g.39194  ORF Transcript_15750/g.39194 Transcript_15750/m.39194 type:complete len:114 (-) Transcript_15750:1049-1390(-)
MVCSDFFLLDSFVPDDGEVGGEGWSLLLRIFPLSTLQSTHSYGQLLLLLQPVVKIKVPPAIYTWTKLTFVHRVVQTSSPSSSSSGIWFEVCGSVVVRHLFFFLQWWSIIHQFA